MSFSTKEATETGHKVVTMALEHSATADSPDVELLRAQAAELERRNALLAAENERLRDDLESHASHKAAEQRGLNEYLRKVNHYSRVVTDADKSKAFYTDVLGCTVLNRPNFPVPGYWLWMGNLQLHLIEGAHVDLRLEGVPVGNVNHISFEAHDIGRIQARLDELKVPYQKKLIPEAGYLLVQLFFCDPDGYYIEICTCNEMNDFIFAEDPSLVREGRAAAALKGYTEGVEPIGPTLALMAGVSWAAGTDPLCSSKELFDAMLQNLKKAFSVVAPGKDEVEPADVLLLLRKLGHDNVNEAQLQSLCASVDLDGSKSLTFAELIKLFVELIKGTRDNILQALQTGFSAADKDGNGFLCRSEINALVWGLGIPMDEDALDKAFADADKDSDGKICVKELADSILRTVDKLQDADAE